MTLISMEQKPGEPNFYDTVLDVVFDIENNFATFQTPVPSADLDIARLAAAWEWHGRPRSGGRRFFERYSGFVPSILRVKVLVELVPVADDEGYRQPLWFRPSYIGSRGGCIVLSDGINEMGTFSEEAELYGKIGDIVSFHERKRFVEQRTDAFRKMLDELVAFERQCEDEFDRLRSDDEIQRHPWGVYGRLLDRFRFPNWLAKAGADEVSRCEEVGPGNVDCDERWRYACRALNHNFRRYADIQGLHFLQGDWSFNALVALRAEAGVSA